MKNQLFGKNPDAGKDREHEKRVTEDEMVGWHHQLNGHVFEQTLGDGGGPGTLVCCIHMGLQRVRHDRATEQQQHSCLGNPMEREAKQTMVHGIAKSQTQLINETIYRIFPRTE